MYRMVGKSSRGQNLPETDTLVVKEHPRHPIKSWLNRKQAAIYLAEHGCPVSYRTLERWAANRNAGGGPPFTSIRWNFVRYLKDDLDAWMNKVLRRIT